MQVNLIMFRSDGEKRRFALTRDMSVLGRAEDCDFRIPLSEISRKHCRLVRDGDALRVEDLGSSNGTFVNDQRVQQKELGAGDLLRVGPVVFVVQLDGEPPDARITRDVARGGRAGRPFDPMDALSDDVVNLDDSGSGRGPVGDLDESNTR